MQRPGHRIPFSTLVIAALGTLVAMPSSTPAAGISVQVRSGHHGIQHGGRHHGVHTGRHGLRSGHHGSRHGVSKRHHSSRGAVGDVKIKRISPRVHSHRQATHFQRPGFFSRRHIPGAHHRSFRSPAGHFFSRRNSTTFSLPRHPASVRSHSVYPGTTTLYRRGRGDDHIDGWEILVQGYTLSALSHFGRQARRDPGAGLPKLGYAISAAAAGDLKLGIRAMRRAFRLDPGSLRHFHVDPRLQPVMLDLIGTYRYALEHRRHHRDEAFMVAALSYFNHDYAGAHEAAERARRDGDRSRSIRTLQAFLAEAPRHDEDAALPDY